MPSIISNYAYSVFEGEWNNFRFRRIEPSDYKAVLDHIANNFVRDEPTCKLLGYSEELGVDFSRIVSDMLTDNLSFLAEDIHTNEIAGVRITFHHKKNQSFGGVTMNSVQGKLLLKLLDEVEEMANTEAKLGIDNWAEFFLTSTAPKYRQQGLAGEFYKRSIAFLKTSGFKHVLVVVSSPFTRIATEKQGFEELSCLNYKDFLGFDGKRAFRDEELDNQHFACVKVKTL